MVKETVITATAASMVCQKKSQAVSVTSSGNLDAAMRTIAMMIMKTERQRTAARTSFLRRSTLTFQIRARGIERTKKRLDSQRRSGSA